MSGAQLAFWEDAMAKLAQSDEWKKDMDANLWENNYLGSADSRRYFEGQYEISRRVLSDLGLAK